MMNTPASSQSIESIPKTKQRSIFGHKCGQHLMALSGLLLATATPALALSYVSGSLTDTNATNGNGVSSPAGAFNVQYSDGSGANGTNYGQINIADDPADPAWVYDQGTTNTISSVTFWSDASSTSFSRLPSGTITIYGSTSPTGPIWHQIGQVTRSMVRDTVLPNSQAIAGEAYRVPCDGSSYRYVRINVVTPGTVGGLDNQWIIRRVEVNKNLVINHFHRTSNNSSVINDLPRIPYNIVDGNTATMWNPQATDMVLTLDLGPTPRRFQQIILTPSAGEASYLPQTGEVYVSSTDDPDNMDTQVGSFNISYNNINTDGATIILGQPFTKRFVQIHWTKVRNSALTETRIAEIQVDSVPDKPVGVDITSTSIPVQYRIAPEPYYDPTVTADHLQAALDFYKYVYIPPGTYDVGHSIYMPTDSRLYGNSDDTTILKFTTTDSSIRVAGTDFVKLDHFQFNRTVDNADEAGIYVYKTSTGDIPYYTEIDNVKIVDNRSRSGAINCTDAVIAGVTNCTILGSQRIISTPDEHDLNGGNFWYIYGSGIQVLRGEISYVANNHVEEQRNMVALLPASPRKKNFIQAGGIEAAATGLTVISNNYVRRYANAYDINGSRYSWVVNNTAREISETGIKFANGTNYCNAIGNDLDQCGLTGIWFTPGSANLSCHHNQAVNNLISETGQGITSTDWNGSGFWLGTFSWSPAALCVDKASTSAARADNIKVINNTSRFNGAVKSPYTTYSFFVNSATYAPTNMTVSGNTTNP